MAMLAASSLTIVLLISSLACPVAASGGSLKQQQQQQHQQLRASGTNDPETPQLIVAKSTPRNQHMMICNAYADQAALDMTFVRTNVSLKPLTYKECSELNLALQEGDQLDVQCRSMDVGTFAVSGLPHSAQTLVLIIKRRPGQSTGATFTSHAFSEEASGSAQVAVIDTYQGERKRNQVNIIAFKQGANASLPPVKTTEALPMNSVVAVSPGAYQVAFEDDAAKPLIAQPKSSYVVLRVGGSALDEVEAKVQNFPEEIVVFPQSSTRHVAVVGSLIITLFVQLALIF